MLRLSPRLVAALLWCAIALLPLRGLAASWMAGEMALGTTAVASADASLPCHAAPPADDGAAPAPHLCTACDLCHAGVTVAPAAPSLVGTPASAAPDEAFVPSHHGRLAPDGLFRPPR
jgi:hypothetical protein